ncbi:catechol 2,3-dioxygenase-like lactoylglutathione lyase family enzyme [Mycolicibacterium sp. BK556]|uniref:VOC family protein n=1 Tax=unclassified Mycolicibacterium TaxID=2636767 RepID=UPI00162177B1|nr:MULTISPECIES: VOC family protein [unclassified Mycolicibacterium]MBB3603774.1 catechol 2,3-dioxygenase-like lactoylglutathione lyase family enzyme [Mycolicibacterium sp. BK556]MBB3633969.1 catechol 2,3-dioxygenase-like lactoylglutathione lyase family enzyme [Mycolicibacterium sp. BK607]
MTLVHHTALCVADIDASLRFYRDGIGLTVLADVSMDADLHPLLGVATTSLRTVFLGAAGNKDSGIVELLDLGEAELANHERQQGLPVRGVFLLSFQVDIEAVLSRLADLGLGGTPRTMPTPSGLAATVVDPDGVMVELLPTGPLKVLQTDA